MNLHIDKNPKVSDHPCLGFILVGAREDSSLYVKMKKKACEEIGIQIKGNNISSNSSIFHH